MYKLETYLNKNVEITDVDNKKWIGIVDDYTDDDDFGDYQGESIDLLVTETNQLICFGITDIKSINIIA
ncbi:MAG: hypothetical protein K2H23_03900 [Oscillospiraceae bacterium]|nr:hypothetical protein [Oscillospiraceae bacterium]